MNKTKTSEPKNPTTAALVPQVYWFVLTSDTADDSGSSAWNYPTQHAAGNMWLGGGYQTSPDGVNWTRRSDREFQFAVYANMVPEPSALALLALGGAWLAAMHRRRFKP